MNSEHQEESREEAKTRIMKEIRKTRIMKEIRRFGDYIVANVPNYKKRTEYYMHFIKETICELEEKGLADEEARKLHFEKELKNNLVLRDWKGNPVEFEFGCPFYPLYAFEFSQRKLKQYNNDPELAFQKTGLRLPLTMSNIRGQVGKIYKKCSTIMDRKPKLVFP
tara:strand:+ start:1027 stop:1524 length:498 start_codon:yes stop_codon:yes gene_type:complete